jgi:signal transduction histidine kinase/HAMP domain-containing protein
MRLQLKVPLLVLLISAVIGVIFGFIMVQAQRQANERQFEQAAMALANAVQGSLEQAMMLGEAQHVQEAVVRVGEEEMVNRVAIHAPDGSVAASSDPSAIGNAAESEVVHTTIRTGQASSIMNRQDSAGELLIATPIVNRAECAGCHGSTADVLGAVQVGLNTSSLDAETTRQTVLAVLVGGLSFTVIAGGVALAMRRMVLNPLSRLASSAQTLAGGDYTARAANGSGDEIGLLAGAFNEMATNIEQRTLDLEDSQRELAQSNEDLESKVQRRTSELSTLNAIIAGINDTRSLDRTLGDALDRILILMEMEAGMVHLYEEETDSLVLVAHNGLAPDYLARISAVSPGEGAIGQVMQSGEPIVTGDGGGETGGIESESGRIGDGITLPVQSKNTVLGTLSLARQSSAGLEYDTIRLLMAMAEALGIAVDNSRTARHLEDAGEIREQLLEKLITAQEEERRRIARELHDDASQSLAALAISLDGIADALPTRNRDAKHKLELLRQQAIQTLSRIRNLALELRPSALDDLGLTMAIDWYAKDYLANHGIEVEIEVAGDEVKLPSYTETMLFRIVQEALTNIVKHAAASRVTVKVEFAADTVVAQVTDDGAGFDVDSAMGSGGMRRNLGIHGMTERATLLGGRFAIRSRRGEGTRLRVEVPLEEEDSGHERDSGTPG